jgi:hypothetical protein
MTSGISEPNPSRAHKTGPRRHALPRHLAFVDRRRDPLVTAAQVQAAPCELTG